MQSPLKAGRLNQWVEILEPETIPLIELWLWKEHPSFKNQSGHCTQPPQQNNRRIRTRFAVPAHITHHTIRIVKDVRTFESMLWSVFGS